MQEGRGLCLAQGCDFPWLTNALKYECSHHGVGLSVKEVTITVPLVCSITDKASPRCLLSSYMFSQFFSQPLSLKWRESNKRNNFPLQIGDIPLYRLLTRAYEFVLWAGICFWKADIMAVLEGHSRQSSLCCTGSPSSYWLGWEKPRLTICREQGPSLRSREAGFLREVEQKAGVCLFVFVCFQSLVLEA